MSPPVPMGGTGSWRRSVLWRDYGSWSSWTRTMGRGYVLDYFEPLQVFGNHANTVQSDSERVNTDNVVA
jgi:hypothetical protein